jgi:hypothetical protein
VTEPDKDAEQQRLIFPKFFRWCCVGAALLFCLGVAMKLNGSSIGMWRTLLLEPGIPRGLLFSSPKQIRVDEWCIWTPAMLSQARQKPPFPIENSNLGAARAPLLMNVPVAYYTTFFRPQLWGFFLFDFERGFSFYWCSKVFGLLLAVGWCLRQMGLRSRALIIFGVVWVFFSSYMQWWFSSPAMLPEMVASWAICLGCAAQFFRDCNPWRIAAAFAGFVFFAGNFVLCLYPPYQIPLLLLAVAILVGVWLENRRGAKPSSGTRGLILIGASVAAVALVLIPFWIDVRSTLALVAQTAYPGARRSTGGDLSLFKLFSGLTGFFETEQVEPGAYDNICEASNFYPMWPAAALTMLVARWRLRMSISPLLAALAVYLICLSLYCVVPMPGWLLRGTFLSFATEQRALLGIGLANILFCCLFLDRYRARVFTNAGAVTAGLALWLAVAVLLQAIRVHDRAFFFDTLQFILLLAINAVIIALFFWETMRPWLPPVLGALLVLSNAGINPIMRGLSPLLDSNAFKAIDSVRSADPDGKWIVYHSRYFAQLVKATGAPVLNGTKILPDLQLLRRIDPKGAGDFIYNRYANIAYELPKHPNQINFNLIYPDFYMAFISPDYPVLQQAGCRYLMFPNVWLDAESNGFSLVKEIHPSRLWIYRNAADGGL